MQLVFVQVVEEWEFNLIGISLLRFKSCSTQFLLFDSNFLYHKNKKIHNQPKQLLHIIYHRVMLIEKRTNF